MTLTRTQQEDGRSRYPPRGGGRRRSLVLSQTLHFHTDDVIISVNATLHIAVGTVGVTWMASCAIHRLAWMVRMPSLAHAELIAFISGSWAPITTTMLFSTHFANKFVMILTPSLLGKGTGVEVTC